METTAVDRYEAKLHERRKEVMIVLDHLDGQSRDVTGNRHFDWLDQAWDNSTARTVDRLRELYTCELESVDRALNRLLDGTYGSCIACHQAIEPSRLDHFPQTEFCRECREFRESFERAA
jgi:RNA polymerase-binding transcription factor DksA